MAKFKAFKPQALERIAKTMGYTGDMSGFQQYLDSNVSLKERMKQLEDSAMEMSKNGTIKQTQKQSEDTVGAFVPPPTQTFDPVQMQQGGMAQPLPQQYIPQAQYQPGQQIQIKAPDGRVVAVTIPAGLQEGSQFQVKI